MHRISDTVNRKFVDSLEIDDWQIETEDGWVDITHINKTIPYEKWTITTQSGLYLECADNHILFDENHQEIFAKDLTIGSKIIGQYGIEVISSINNTGIEENMYDISVTGNHTFYAEGLLHHNTTIAAAFFVWYVLFTDNKSIAILANKQATALEIISRIRLMYENLPLWLQQGVKKWNEGAIILENNSRIFGAATSSSGIRGKTINCVDGDTEITICNYDLTNKRKIKISELYHENTEITKYENISTKGSSFHIETNNQPIQKLKVLSEGCVFRNFKGVKCSSVNKTIKITFTDGTYISCTPDHKIMTYNGYTFAKDVYEGLSVVSLQNKIVLSKEFNYNETLVYDLVEVEKTHNFYANDVLTHQCLYIDEMAFIPNNQAEDFFTSVYPTVTASKNSKVILTSTPNGYNLFYKFWSEAERGINGFNPVRAHWWESPGRDKEWYDTQVKVLGELKAAQEIDAEFMGSSKTLLSAKTMQKLIPDKPIKEYSEGNYQGFKIYKEPEEGHSYVMTVDVSRGRHLDYSAFLMIDVTKAPFTIAASYYNNEISPMLYASFCHKIAKNYKDAYTLIEINDIGAQVADTMYYELEYEYMFWSKAGDILGKTGADPYPGLRTTKKTKRIGCANLKDLIDNDTFVINDATMISELSTFIQSDTGSYEADEGMHDDLVMCGVMFGWMTTQTWFKDLTNTDARVIMHKENIQNMEVDLPAFMKNIPTETVSANYDPEALSFFYPQ